MQPCEKGCGKTKKKLRGSPVGDPMGDTFRSIETRSRGMDILEHFLLRNKRESKRKRIWKEVARGVKKRCLTTSKPG